MTTVGDWWSSVLKGDCVGYTYFKHRSLQKYTRVGRGQDGVEVKSMIHLVLVKKDTLCFVQDVRALRGMGQALSDHHVLLCKVWLLGAWIKSRELVVGASRIRSGKLKGDWYSEDMLGFLRGRE